MKVAKLLIGLSFTSALAAAGGSFYLYQQTQTLKFNNQELESSLVQLREQNATLKHQADQADSYKQEIERLRDQTKDLLRQRNTLRSEIDAEAAKVTELEQQLEEVEAEKKELEAKLSLSQATDLGIAADLAATGLVLPSEDSVPPLELPTSFKPGAEIPPAEAAAPKEEPIKPVTIPTESLPGIPVVSSEPKPVDLKKQLATPKAERQSETKQAVPAKIEEPKKVETKIVEAKKEEAKKEEAKAPAKAPVIRPAEDTRPQQVLSVNRQFNFVVVNVGLRDKIKIGDVLRVEDKGKMIGKIQVEKLYDNFSACAIMEEIKPAQIHEGDLIRIG